MRSSSAKNKTSRNTNNSSSEGKHSILNNKKKTIDQNISDSRKTSGLESKGVSDFSSISILPSIHNGPQAKLKINSPNDKYEIEADRVAEQVTRTPNQRLHQNNIGDRRKKEIRRASNLSLQRKCNECEEEEVIQTKSMGNSEGIASQGFINQLQNTRGGGQSMDSSTRSFMESRIGADFSGVKVHTDGKAAGMSQEINAKAFTLGQDVYFNQGTYNPSSIEGKKLLAHELTHTIQQGKSSAFSQDESHKIQRAPLDEKTEEDPEEICVMVYVGTDINGGSAGGTCEPLTENTEVDMFYPSIYEGDVLQIKADELVNPPTNWVLPPELEFVQDIDDRTIMVRVLGKPGAGEEERKVKVTINTEEGKPNVTVIFTINKLNPKADATNPELVQNEKKRSDAKLERKAKRQEFKSEKKELRKDFRSLDREGKRENRDTFRSNKASLKKERKTERKELRKEKKELRNEKKTLNTASSCNLDYQRMITSALNKAISVTSTGIGKLQKGTSDTKVKSQLASIMKWSTDSKSDAQNGEVIQKISDVLNVASNNMLLSKHSSFICGSEKCSELTGAFVNGGNGRGGNVTVCTNWLLKKVNFGFTGTPDDHQAFALLHEFVHLSGPQGKNETYVHNKGEWNKLSHQQALEMADAYARIAWELGG